MSGILLLVLAAVTTACVLLFFRNRTRKPLNLPPGPTPLPLVGNFHQVDYGNVSGTYCKYAKQYGSIFTLKLLGQRIILLNDAALVREVFGKDEFTFRPNVFVTKLRSLVNNGATGVIFTDGNHWKEHRRFVLTHFKDSGVGKSRSEEKIIEEALHLKDVLADFSGKPIVTKVPISTAVANVIASILTGHRYEPDDPEFVKFLELNRRHFAFSRPKGIMQFLPWTRYVIPQVRAKYHETIEVLKGLRQFFSSSIEKHMQMDATEYDQDFLGAYISAIKSGSYQSFSVSEIPVLLEDLFEAGYDTTTTTLRWAFLLVALHKEVQARIHKELDSELPMGVPLRPSEKLNIPYVEATLMETLRFASTVPQGLPHRAEDDAKIGDYDIPKGSWIMPNIRYIHRDPTIWDEPERFQPQRFLTSSNEVLLPEQYIPFSVGKRRCPGETLAKSELQIFFITILQSFTVKATPCPGLEEIDLVPVPGLTADTKPHLLRFIPRSLPG